MNDLWKGLQYGCTGHKYTTLQASREPDDHMLPVSRFAGLPSCDFQVNEKI
jgi:hypothetical protein